MKCKKCGTENLSIDNYCKSCKELLESKSNISYVINSPRYPTLVTLSKIYRVLAYLSIIAGILTAILLLTNSRPALEVYISFISGIVLLIGGLSYSEIIKLFIDIEENTRSNQKT